jgi:hypothetical protein
MRPVGRERSIGMIPYFQRLGERIERAWLCRSYDEEIFPRLALDELERDPPFGQVETADLIDWTFGPFHEFPQPGDSELFGEPPVMLYQAPRFYIEALFWFSGTTSIHQHGFSGAFAVLAGSSVHSHWRFAPERAINSRMLCGRLERVATEILRPGGMRPIHPGNRLIHQLFHLEMPSVTLVVRTRGERNQQPQFSYRLPGLAIDTFDQDPLRRRRLMFLHSMAGGQIDGLAKYARRMVESGDLVALYYTFSLLTQSRVDKELLGELYDIARQRYGETVDLLQQVCEGERRTRVVAALRAKISDPEARFLLALLMLMPDRDAIFEAIRLQFPNAEPLGTIETWLAGISGKETIGFNFNGFNRLVFRSLVEGVDIEELFQRVRAECPDQPVGADRDRLREHAKKMAGSVLFYPLFSKSPLREEILVAR